MQSTNPPPVTGSSTAAAHGGPSSDSPSHARKQSKSYHIYALQVRAFLDAAEVVDVDQDTIADILEGIDLDDDTDLDDDEESDVDMDDEDEDEDDPTLHFQQGEDTQSAYNELSDEDRALILEGW